MLPAANNYSASVAIQYMKIANGASIRSFLSLVSELLNELGNGRVLQRSATPLLIVQLLADYTHIQGRAQQVGQRCRREEMAMRRR